MPPSALPLIGHAKAIQLLIRLAQRQRLPAATLLTGPPSIGKRAVAEALLETLLGVSGPAALERHPDILRIDGADTAGQREVAVKLLERVHGRPLMAPVTVVMLLDTDRLSDAAAALLLKAIEDAPPFARFLLTAVSADRVSATLRSRCLTRELTPVAHQEIVRGLAARGVSEAVAMEVARLSGGRPGLALRLAADEVLLNRYRLWDAAIRFPAGTVRSRRELAQSFESPEDAEEFLAFLQGTVRSRAEFPILLRRSREGIAMVRQHVPPELAVEYVLGGLAGGLP